MATTNRKDQLLALMPLSKARNRLALLWLSAAGALFLLLIAQSVLGHFEDKAQKVWSWALPTMMPTLTLIITVLGTDALKPEDPSTAVRVTYYRLAIGASAFYLFLVIGNLLVEPLTSLQLPDLLQLSNLWLGPLQGLATAAVGILFFKRQGHSEKSAGTAGNAAHEP